MTRQPFTRKQCRHSGMHAGASEVWTVTLAFLCWQLTVVLEECIVSVRKSMTNFVCKCNESNIYYIFTVLD